MSELNKYMWAILNACVEQAEQHQEMSELWRRMDDLERLQEQQLEEMAALPAEHVPAAQPDL